jgi:hypothetical protein
MLAAGFLNVIASLSILTSSFIAAVFFRNISLWESFLVSQASICDPCAAFSCLCKNSRKTSGSWTCKLFIAFGSSFLKRSSSFHTRIICFGFFHANSHWYILIKDHTHICVEHHLLLVLWCSSVNSHPLVLVNISIDSCFWTPTFEKKRLIISIVENTLVSYIRPGSIIS